MRHVHDGDTVLLADGTKVRLLGIDAPELDAEDATARALAGQARDETRRLCEGRRVTLLVGTPASDAFGRTLAYVELVEAQGEADVGALLLSRGFAQVYSSAHPRLDDYRRLERGARERSAGLWAPSAASVTGLAFEATVEAKDAASHVGRRVRVVGTAVRVSVVEAGAFVDFGPRRADFTAVAFRRVLPLFPADLRARWQGRRLAVTGLVKLHEGTPEIVLNRPEQVEVLAD